MDSQAKAAVIDSIATPSSGRDEPAIDAAPFSPRLLSVGFIFGLVISSVLMISCVVYLFTFMISTTSDVSKTLTQTQLTQSQLAQTQLALIQLTQAQQAQALHDRRSLADTNKNATSAPTSESAPVVPSIPIVSYAENERLATLSVYSRLMTAGLVFNSCGLMIGVAMAFLGLSLFLLGVKGQMDAKGKTERFSVQLIRVSPGALALICSALIVFACLHYKPQMHIGRDGEGDGVTLMGKPMQRNDR